MVNKAIAVLAAALAVTGCARDEGHDWLGGAGTLHFTRSAAPAETYEIQEARARRVPPPPWRVGQGGPGHRKCQQ